jgi:aminoglycoside phosphotransferase (APT) family kinase protein
MADSESRALLPYTDCPISTPVVLMRVLRIELDGRIPFAEGREAEVFRLKDGSALKLMRHPDSIGRVEREAAAMRILSQNGHRAPAVRGIVEIDGRPGLVTEYIKGPDLFTRLSAHPWKIWQAGSVMAMTHAAMHECQAPASLPELHDDLKERITTAPSPLPSAQTEAVLELLGRLPRGDRLCHGDFHLGNLLADWDVPVVIDWGDAARGDPLADVARTELLHRLGEPPPGTSRLLETLIPIGRGILAHRYVSTYRRCRGIDAARLEKWKIVRAAARVAEGIDSETESLLGYLRERMPVDIAP